MDARRKSPSARRWRRVGGTCRTIGETIHAALGGGAWSVVCRFGSRSPNLGSEYAYAVGGITRGSRPHRRAASPIAVGLHRRPYIWLNLRDTTNVCVPERNARRNHQRNVSIASTAYRPQNAIDLAFFVERFVLSVSLSGLSKNPPFESEVRQPQSSCVGNYHRILQRGFVHGLREPAGAPRRDAEGCPRTRLYDPTPRGENTYGRFVPGSGSNIRAHIFPGLSGYWQARAFLCAGRFIEN